MGTVPMTKSLVASFMSSGTPIGYQQIDGNSACDHVPDGIIHVLNNNIGGTSRSMGTVHITMSMISSFMSLVTLIGVPADMNNAGP
jgi:hypothetical protein